MGFEKIEPALSFGAIAGGEILLVISLYNVRPIYGLIMVIFFVGTAYLARENLYDIGPIEQALWVVLLILLSLFAGMYYGWPLEPTGVPLG